MFRKFRGLAIKVRLGEKSRKHLTCCCRLNKTETPHETTDELVLCLGNAALRSHALSPICCGEAVRGRQDVMHHVGIKHPAMPGNPTLVFFARALCQPQCFLCRCHRAKRSLAGERRLRGMFLRRDPPRFPCLSLPPSCCKALRGREKKKKNEQRKHESLDKLAGVCALLILALTP